ncbi:hypothetical protein [Rubritalea tangerina]|uniref:Uncharacterized protein n=1 Tax=Rubritalea tangerina TaxID=430798 RepID=A0ABW4ZB26_9BACT
MIEEKDSYFFDYSTLDACSTLSSAVKLLYHGSSHGAFGVQSEARARTFPLDIERISAIKVSLKHLSSSALAEGHEYNLLLVDDVLADALWENKVRNHLPALKEITRRVKLGGAASLKAKRYKEPIWVRFQKPIYIVQYTPFLVQDMSIPQAYRDLLKEKFRGFLVRTAPQYPAVTQIVEASGFELLARREIKDVYDDQAVVCYAYQEREN